MTGDTGLLLRITLVVGLVLASVTAAHADEPTLLDRTISTCVGPEFNPALDLNGMIAGITGESCVRACRAAERGCKAVVRAVDRCGVSFLRAAAKTRIEVCRGLGGTSRECRVFKDIVKPDIAWWKAAGKEERADCEAHTQTLCLSRCESAMVAIYSDLIPAGVPFPPQGEAGGAIEYLVIGTPLILPALPAPPQGEAGVTLTILPGTRLAAPLIVPESSQEGVRELAEDAIEFLER